MGLNGIGQRKWVQVLVGFIATLGLILAWHGALPPLAQALSPSSPRAQGIGVPSTAQPLRGQNGLPATTPPPVIPTDIAQHWAADCLTALAQTGLITADGNGLFYPNDPILWGDYVALLNRVWPPEPSGSWANSLERALGIAIAPTVAGHYPSYYFQPDRPLVRAEAMMALAAKLGANYQVAANALINNSFRDGRQVPDYAREGVAAALVQGVVVNYPEADRLNPSQRLTRGEAAALVCRSSPLSDLRRWIAPAWVATARPPETIPTLNPEMRGVWLTNIDSPVLFSTETLAQAVDQLAALNFNTLYPTVWNWGYTLYPSRTAQRELGARQHLYGELSTPSLEASQGDRDMLKEAIDLGHAKGMAVIPWFEFGFMAPEPYELYRRHPDWFTQKWVEPSPPPAPTTVPTPGTVPKGRLSVPDLASGDGQIREKQRAEQWLAQHKERLAQGGLPGEQPLPSPNDPGIWLESNVLPRRWLNPFHPQVQKFMLELINDLVSNYEIDGFQFDDHLGLPVEFGYDPYTINLYKAEHNGQAPPANYQDEAWVAWRANKISDFLAEVYKLVKARRPQAMVSISPNPYPFAYVNYLQDWPTWVNRGLVDELVIQIYRNNQNRFIWELNKPSLQTALRKIPTSVGILSGLRATPVGVNHIGEQIHAVRDRRLSGMAFFFYESLWLSPPQESRENRLAKLQEMFATPVPRPKA